MVDVDVDLVVDVVECSFSADLESSIGSVLANPKSHIFIVQVLMMRILAGFKSRCRTLAD